MSDNLASNFWDIVGKPGSIADLEVGDVATLEMTRDGKVIGHRLIRVVKKMTSDEGLPQVQMEDVQPGESYTHSGVTLVGEW